MNQILFYMKFYWYLKIIQLFLFGSSDQSVDHAESLDTMQIVKRIHTHTHSHMLINNVISI